MRIDNNSGINRVQGVRPKNMAGVDELAASGHDSVELSSRAADVRAAMEALSQAPEVREDLVADLRQQLEAGELLTDSGALAAKLLGQSQGTSDP